MDQITFTPLELAVVNSYLTDRRYNKIAKDLDVSVKSVDNALMRVRKKLVNAKRDYRVSLSLLYIEQ